jgi:hypothetical protein
MHHHHACAPLPLASSFVAVELLCVESWVPSAHVFLVLRLAIDAVDVCCVRARLV